MPRPTSRTIGLFATCAVLLLGAACGGDDGATTTTSAPPTDSAEGADHSEHGGDEEHGGHAAHGGGEVGTVADIADLGPGPSVGDRWEIPIGLNICGRFIEAPQGGTAGAVTASDGGIAVVEPTDEGSTGHEATLGNYADAIGVTLSTGEIRLPSGVVPTEIEVRDQQVDLDDSTFRTGDECGGTPAEVQAWVYSADAVTSGQGILTVVEDPQDIPIAQDGMALVIAFTPDSSLPTLPPSALGLG